MYEKQKVMSVVSCLKESSFQVVMQAMKKNPEVNWYKLCQIRLMEFRYNGDVKTYGIKFNQLINQADQAVYSEKVKIQMYRSNLSPKLFLGVGIEWIQ